jgi:glycosyltransferase involved in cell wall biosynthesis
MRNTVILSVYYKHKQGGFTRRLYRAYKAIAGSGQQLIYIATEKLPVAGDNIQPVIISMRSKENSAFYWLEFYIRAVMEMRRLTKQHHVTTHFVFSFFYATISILAARGLSVRTITLIRGDDAFDAKFKRFAGLRRSVHRVLEYIGVRGSAAVVATSQSMQRVISARTGADNICTLANDITTSPLAVNTYQQPETLRIATVSVINERKNLRLAIEALAELKQLPWEYLIIGPDTSNKNLAETLQQLTQELGIGDRVKFLGWQDNAAQYLQDCHLFLFPTLMEGSPNALMEAMGYGLPCLASRIPEVTEVLQDESLHFDPHSKQELVTKLRQFMTDSHYVQQVKERTAADRRRYIFDWDSQIIRLLHNPECA